MIARIWNGSTLSQNADLYVAHLRTNVIPQFAAIEGHRGVYVLRTIHGDLVDFTVITLWESLEAIQRFAGLDAEVAVIADEARALLATHDPRATHLEVLVAQAPNLESRIPNPKSRAASESSGT